MAIDAKLVAELRKLTGLPMMKCKAALVEAGGDIEQAIENLRKQGVKAAEKVAHRELKDGAVFLHATEDGVRDAMPEVFAGGSRTTLLAAFDQFETVLGEHLDEEENLVIPMLLELSPAEFARYSMHSIDTLLHDEVSR